MALAPITYVGTLEVTLVVQCGVWEFSAYTVLKYLRDRTRRLEYLNVKPEVQHIQKGAAKTSCIGVLPMASLGVFLLSGIGYE